MTTKEVRELVNAILLENGIESPIEGSINVFIENGLIDLATNLKGYFVYSVELVGDSYTKKSTDKDILELSSVEYPIKTDIRMFDLQNFVSNGASESTVPTQSLSTVPTFQKSQKLIAVLEVRVNGKRIKYQTEQQFLNESLYYCYTTPQFGLLKFDPLISASDRVVIRYNYHPLMPSDENAELSVPSGAKLALAYYAAGHYMSTMGVKSAKGLFGMYSYELKKLGNFIPSGDSLEITPYDKLQ